MAIRDKLILGSDSLTKADMLIVQELLANYRVVQRVSGLAYPLRPGDDLFLWQ